MTSEIRYSAVQSGAVQYSPVEYLHCFAVTKSHHTDSGVASDCTTLMMKTESVSQTLVYYNILTTRTSTREDFIKNRQPEMIRRCNLLGTVLKSDVLFHLRNHHVKLVLKKF